MAHYINLQPWYCLAFQIVYLWQSGFTNTKYAGWHFINQIMGEVYTYNHANKLFIS